MTLLIPSRRGFLTGLASVLAAPAIVRAASLMPVRALPQPDFLVERLDVLYGWMNVRPEWRTLDMVTRERMRLWKNFNAFLATIDSQYDDAFAADDYKINSTLLIRLPHATS